MFISSCKCSEKNRNHQIFQKKTAQILKLVCHDGSDMPVVSNGVKKKSGRLFGQSVFFFVPSHPNTLKQTKEFKI